MSPATVKLVSECFIKPKYEVQEAKQPYYLAPMDMAMLNFHYIQKGLLFIKPSHINDQEFSTNKLLQSLKESLSIALVHFYPQAGQLTTCISQNRHECLVFVDCNKGPGARFIYATLNMDISEILSPVDVPLIVQSLFDHDRAINHDDGTSYWHFWKIWSEIHRANDKQLLVSRLPNHKRWFPDGYGLAIPLPFTHPNEFVSRFATNNRQRLDPPLPLEYVGNCVTAMVTTTTAGELLGHNLGWAASLLHQSVVNHSDKIVHKFIDGWLQSPFVYRPGKMFNPYSVMMGSSPRFDMYGNEFGLGKAVAVRSGYANKYVGKVTAYPGYEGGGSVDLEICLPPNSMSSLESDEEFLAAVTIQYNGYQRRHPQEA
uniref:Uncharacterized protein n=1 Tax=Chenopodium quinoa TaxID=63459 RepID=A0A803L630_CHEQI